MIELHLLLGDRAAAIRAFKDCEAILRDELGVSPMPETMALILDIGEDAAPTAPAAASSPVWPIAHPPRFIGRKEEIARIQEALEQREIVFLHGPSGIGKSRLAREALRHWERPYFIFDGRPADIHVPFSTHLRALRQVLHHFPEMELEPWVQRAISQLFPEQLEASPGTREHEFAKLYFGEANVEFMKALAPIDATIVVDDMQFHDSATLRLETYMLSSRIGADFKVGSIISMRPDLPRELFDTMERVLEAGEGELIEVPPLDAEEAEALVDALGVAAEPRLLEAAEGNPGALLQACSQLSGDR